MVLPELDDSKKFWIQVITGFTIIVLIVQGILSHDISKTELALNLGYVTGVVGKVMLPFVRKIQEKKIQGFSIKFFWTSIVSIFYIVFINYSVVQIIAQGIELFSQTYYPVHWAVPLFIGLHIGVTSNWTAEEAYKYLNFFLEYYKKLKEKSKNATVEISEVGTKDAEKLGVKEALSILDKLAEETQTEKEAQEAIEEIAEQSVEEQKEEGVM